MKTSITKEEYEILKEYNKGLLNYEELIKIIPELTYEETKAILWSFKDEDRSIRLNKILTIKNFLPTTMTESERAKLYREMLYEDWHGEHERIVADFDRYYPFPENIEALEYILFNPPKGHIYEDGTWDDAFTKNCIWAISHQPSPYNMESLQRLVKSNNERISEIALYHVHRIDPNLPEIDFPYL